MSSTILPVHNLDRRETFAQRHHRFCGQYGEPDVVGHSLTGAIGRHLLQLLLEEERYNKVFSLVRRSSGINHPKLVEKIVSFDALDDVEGMERVDDVYCCLGTTRKKAGSSSAFRQVDLDYVLDLGRLGQRLNASAFTVVSSIGAGDGARGLYFRTKTEMEQGLRNLEYPSLIIVRPSLLHGERDEFRLGEHAAYYGMNALSWLPGVKRYLPINTAQVASAMLKATVRAEPGVTILENRALHEC